MGFKRNEISQWVNVEKDSLLFDIFQSEKLGVNSFHHQAVKNPADNLSVVARSEDGIIEAVSVEKHPFAVAVQWHPEMMFDSDEQLKLVQAFVDACMN